jgi:hypothetical protein
MNFEIRDFHAGENVDCILLAFDVIVITNVLE